MDLGFAVSMVHFKNHSFMFLEVYPVAMLRVESDRGKKPKPKSHQV